MLYNRQHLRAEDYFCTQFMSDADAKCLYMALLLLP